MAQCKNALIRCMDFRLESAIQGYMSENGLVDDCDIIAGAGASKDIIENPDGFIATQVALSVELHSIDQLIIMHHTDCGGYGGSGKHDGHEAEMEFHRNEMHKARGILKEKYPELEIKLVLAVMSDSGISFEDVE